MPHTTVDERQGRDAAGKGGTIKAMTERVSPRVFRVVALPAPSDREKTQMFGQRYIEQFPAAGEIVIFDRSWYNRAGVEYVMGFCSEYDHRRFYTKHAPWYIVHSDDKAGAAQLHLAHPAFDSLQKSSARQGQAAEAIGQGPL